MSVQTLINALQETPAPTNTEVLVGADALIEAVGDFTAGASEDMFTLAAHGLVDGDRVTLAYESAAGVVTGALGDVFIINQLDANTFQLTTDGTTVVENTADGTAVFIKAITTADLTGADAVTPTGFSPLAVDGGYVIVS